VIPYLAYATLAALIALAAIRWRLGWVFSALALLAAVPLMAAPWGKPQPIWAELACRPDATVDPSTVLASYPLEKDGKIFLWLQVRDCVPTAYVMPWSAQMAEQLQQAQEQAEANGTGVRMKFERTYDDRPPKFYADPQEALPDKPPGRAPLVVPETEA